MGLKRAIRPPFFRSDNAMIEQVGKHSAPRCSRYCSPRRRNSLRRNAAHPLRYLLPPLEKSRRLESPALTFAVSV
jgi:hypothetical protein